MSQAATLPLREPSPAEQALAARHREIAESLPGAGEPRLDAARAAAIARFEAGGLPNRRTEEWKYTDLRARLKEVPPPAPALGEAPDLARISAHHAFAGLEPLCAVFVGGRFQPALSDLSDLPEGLEIAPLSAGLPDWAVAEFEERRPDGDNPGFDLSLALATDGLAVRLAAGARIDRPVEILALGAGATSAHLRHIVRLEEGAQLRLIEVHAEAGDGGGGGLATSAVSVALGSGARLDHVKLQAAGAATVHVAPEVIEIGADVALNSFTLSLGAGFAREERHVRFAGEGAHASIAGASVLNGRAHADTTLVVDHAVPACTSRERFRAIVDDNARGVFQGLITVAPGAQKTDARQSVDALLLSDTAEHDAKPELQIFADDVQCAHGATSGEIDADQLFYLMARGICEADAEALLIGAFLAEALEAVEDEALRDALHRLSEAHLAQAAEAGDA